MSHLTYIVIPNWNGKHQLPDCLKSLQAQSVGAKIIVVDNGSTDGSVEWLHRHAKHVVVMELDRNYGFAGGVNRGMTYALERGADFVALFNNDAVAEPDWLASLLKRARQSPRIGIVTGKMLQKGTGRIDTVGEAYSIWAQAFPMGRDQVDEGQFAAARQVFGATGGASLYKTNMLKRIGLMDETFFMYYEDVDLSFRARLSGWQVWYEPKAVAHHEVGGTSRRLAKSFRSYFQLKNSPLVYDKNMPSRLFWRYLPRKLMTLAAITMRMLSRGQLVAVAKAYWHILLHAPRLLADRRHIQHQRKASNKSVESWLYKGAPPMSRTLTRLSSIFDRKYHK